MTNPHLHAALIYICSHIATESEMQEIINAIERDKQVSNSLQPSVTRPTYAYAVTGTRHGAIIEATCEGEARRQFHSHYNGESITHCKKRSIAGLWP